MRADINIEDVTEDYVYKKIHDLCVLWGKIEGRLKAVENFRNKVVIPSINELRYAGRRVVAAWHYYEKINKDRDLQPEDKEFLLENLVAAQSYLYNANDDITDAVVTYSSQLMRDVSEKHDLISIRGVFNEYDKLKEMLNNIQNNQERARQNFNNRRDIYNKIEKEIKDIISLTKGLEEAYAEILKYEKIKEIKTDIKNIIISFVVGTISGIFVAWLSFKYLSFSGS